MTIAATVASTVTSINASSASSSDSVAIGAGIGGGLGGAILIATAALIWGFNRRNKAKAAQAAQNLPYATAKPDHSPVGSNDVLASSYDESYSSRQELDPQHHFQRSELS